MQRTLITFRGFDPGHGSTIVVIRGESTKAIGRIVQTRKCIRLVMQDIKAITALRQVRINELEMLKDRLLTNAVMLRHWDFNNILLNYFFHYLPSTINIDIILPFLRA